MTMPDDCCHTRLPDAATAVQIRVTGLVQGVGFRPFVYRLATGLGLSGFVRNDSGGVEIVVAGPGDRLDRFQRVLLCEPPPVCRIDTVRVDPFTSALSGSFRIVDSRTSTARRAFVPPDLAVCPDCLSEMRDRSDRRFAYPFINCTNCGPRASISHCLPYDRSNTSMTEFAMCGACRHEYEDPGNRRFHAEPIACPVCGPRLELRDNKGTVVAGDPIVTTARFLAEGYIVAIKGIGGFHLAVDASNETAVRTLRSRKGRPHKPLALMARDIDTVCRIAAVDTEEASVLSAYDRPIVLLEKTSPAALPNVVAPGVNSYGVMLPYAPVHYLLFDHAPPVLVMTSGNVSDEPVVGDTATALDCLGGIADYFLTNNRDIVRTNDDSIVRVIDHAPRVMRRSRGMVPLPVPIARPFSAPILAVGGDLKAACGVGIENQFHFGEHIGDLTNRQALARFTSGIAAVLLQFGVSPRAIACDNHPDYLSTRWAGEQTAYEVVPVQHHHAHMVSAMAENLFDGRCLGVILDGTGYGSDGTIWGGEFLIGDRFSVQRSAHLRTVPQPGGDAATQHPWRMALSWLSVATNTVDPKQLSVWLPEVSRANLVTVCESMARGINSPQTSSCGRLFDAVAAMLGLVDRVSYEGQAAIALESIADTTESRCYDSEISSQVDSVVDPTYIFRQIQRDLESTTALSLIAGRFHRSLAHLMSTTAIRLCRRHELSTVALSGGVFQNRYLLELMLRELRAEGLQVLTQSRVPCNDGGLALGQAVIAAARIEQKAR